MQLRQYRNLPTLVTSICLFFQFIKHACLYLYRVPFRKYGDSSVENRQLVPTPVSFNSLAPGDPFKFRDEPILVVSRVHVHRATTLVYATPLPLISMISDADILHNVRATRHALGLTVN